MSRRPLPSALLFAGLCLPPILHFSTPAGATESCSSIISQRNRTFDLNRKNEQAIAQLSRQVSAQKEQIKLLEGVANPQQRKSDQETLAVLEDRLGQFKWAQVNTADKLAALDQQVAACRTQSSTHLNYLDRWNGTWHDGPYKIELSAGRNSLSYTAERFDPVPAGCNNCIPLSDRGSGTCTVKGSVATCNWHMRYKDSAKEVDRTGHGTLWFVASSQSDNDRISYKFIEDTGTIVLTDGTCPDISKCTGMHPGAEWDGYWTRKTPG